MLPICNFTDGSRMAAVMLSIILCEKSNDNVGESDMARKRASQRNSGSFLMVHVCFSDQSMVFPSECIHCFGFFISLSSRLVCFSISPLLFPTARKPSSRRGIAEMPYLPLTPYAPQPQKHRSLLHYAIYYSAKFNNVNLFGRFHKKSAQIFKKICALLNLMYKQCGFFRAIAPNSRQGIYRMLYKSAETFTIFFCHADFRFCCQVGHYF